MHKTWMQASKRKKQIIIVGSLLVLLIAILLIIYTLSRPERSVASFCRMAIENKSDLKAGSSNEQRLDAYKKLESVAPEDIHSDITTIRKGYESIVQDPSKTLSVGFGISGSENRRTAYLNKNCSEFNN